MMATIVIGETRIRSIILIVFVVLATMELANSVPLRRSHSRTIRLCSRSLSDALYMVCRNRGGYNEPFSYSGQDEPHASTGPGLVEECCYHSCSFDQLEQYCKADEKQENGNNQGVMEEALRIVNLPDSRDLSSSEDKLRTRSRIGHVGGMKKRSIRK